MEAPYLLIPILIGSLILYSITFILHKTGIIAKSVHRKIWNTILLITFSVTAVLGILLAIQINYKLEWQVVKAILKWHVNFGIAMAFVSVVHLVWHFNYYLKLFNKENKPSQQTSNITSSNLQQVEFSKILVFLSGFAATVIQVLFLREITTIFQGNELLMAWSLGIWMSLTGLGALLGRNIHVERLTLKTIPNVLSLLAILPYICIIFFILIKGLLFPTGILIHPLWFVVIVLILFAPVGILSGWLFSAFIKTGEYGKTGFETIYVLETIGSVIGGLTVTFLFINWLTTLESILILSGVIFLILYLSEKSKSFLIYVSFPTLILVIFLAYPVENHLKSILFSRQVVKESVETGYGNITVTENAGQYNIYENGLLSFTSDNTILSEEYVHYAMLQHKNPGKVLLIGGGLSGMLHEIVKYKAVSTIDYLEPNPNLISIVSEYIPMVTDPRIKIQKGDPKKFLQKTNNQYDIIIMAVADPTSLQTDRFYTSEFLTLIKSRMLPRGIILYGISPAGNYMTTEKINMEASVYNNLKTYFKNVEIIPGEKDYFIASDSDLSIKLSELSSGWEEINTYVNPYYMDDQSIRERRDYILASIKGIPTFNTDDKPRIVFTDTLHYLSLFNSQSSNIFLWLVLILLLPVFFMRPEAKGMFITGITASSVEIILLFIFQLVFGTIYSAIGALIAFFMIGLTIGAKFAPRFQNKKFLIPAVTIILGIIVACIPLALKLYRNAPSFISISTIFIMLLIPAILVGSLYFLYTQKMKSDNRGAPGIIYAADLAGSALGVVATTIILVPILGISLTSYILCGLNIIVWMSSLRFNRK